MRRLVLAVAVAMLIAVPAGCGSDDDESSGAEDEAAAVEEVTLTADDISETEKTFELSATPTPETTSVTFKNEGDEVHALIFARINKGFTVEEALRLQGEKGSAEEIAATDAKPGQEKTIKIDKPLASGSYAMLCPIPNKQGVPHFELGQLEEFEL